MKHPRRSRKGVEWLLVLGGLALVVAIPLFTSSWGTKDDKKPSQAHGSTSRPNGERPTWVAPQADVAVVDSDAQGELRLEGQVIDGDELAVGGATVLISSNPVRTTVTEEDGSFYFDGLLSRRYLLEAMAPAGTAGPVAVALREGTEPVILRLQAGAEIKVAVLDAASGAAIQRATVGLRGLSARSATTDEQGHAVFQHVAPGRYEIAAFAAGYGPDYTTAVVEGTNAVALSLALRPGAAVSGRVLTPEGEPVPNAMVYHEAVSEFATGITARLDAVATDNAGRFQFASLGAGSFRFHARHPDFAPGSSAIVRLDGVSEMRDIEIRLEPGATLRARVETKEGVAVAGATVRVAPARDNWLPAPVREAYTDTQGEVVMRALPRARTEIVAVHDSGSSDVALVDLRSPPHEQERVLVLVHTDTISGIVVDTANQPVEGAQVTARKKGALALPVATGPERLRGTAIELTDAGGGFTLSGLPQGQYELRASRRTAATRFLDPLRRATEAKTGDTGVRITLVADGGITGRVALGDGRAPGTFLVELSGAQPTPVFSPNGEFTLSDVPPGTYLLAVRGPSFGRVQVPNVVVAEGAVTDVGTIKVGRESGRRIAGVVLADGQPVPGALVQVGSSIMASGASIKMRGSSMFGNTREAVTDENGRFSISGLRAVPLTAIAEHESFGRSAPIALDVSPATVDGLVLELFGFGSLSGRVTNRGEPVDGLNVGLQSMDANGLQFVATTGSDGGYNFDNLAPGRYKLSAMFGDMSGMSFHGLMVAVETGKTTTADLALDQGELSLATSLRSTSAPECRFAWINVVAGVITARDAAELSTIVLRGDQRYSAFAVYSEGAPAVVSGLSAGTYTVCAVPFPDELSSQSEYREYHERAARSLPVFCQAIELEDAQKRREITLEVAVPAFVPPAAEQ